MRYGVAKERLRAVQDQDGGLHASMPTATRTLCGLETDSLTVPELQQPPTCDICFDTASVWEVIDGSAPPPWRGRLRAHYARTRKKRTVAEAA